MTALVLALALQGQGLDVEALRHPARHAREDAIAALARGSIPTAVLVAHLSHEDSRVARAVIAALAKRLDPEALAALARCAGHADPARAETAARAAVLLAFETCADGEALLGQTIPPDRLARAVSAEVKARLSDIRGWGNTDRPQDYRPLLSGGRHVARALEDIATTAGHPESMREHALYALALLEGAAAAPLLTRLLDDGSRRVRGAACSLLCQCGAPSDRRTLARRLEGPRLHGEIELAWIVAAVERTGVVGDAGAQRLERLVREGVIHRALGAAAALRRPRPEAYRRAIRLRLMPALLKSAARATIGGDAALFALRVGPLEDDLVRAMAASANPLLRAMATADPKKALEILAPQIAPGKPAGSRELRRIRIVEQLLRRLRAPDGDRVRFARPVLNRQSPVAQRAGLSVLTAVPRAAYEDLVPRLEALLDAPFESVRLLAAGLLADDHEKAVEVAILALYDGDPGGAFAAAAILRRARPDWPVADPRASAPKRRSVARALLLRYRSERRGKE